jgi:hypothetical protein
MAILTDLEKTELRHKICRGIAPDFDKLQINSALQAAVDYLSNDRENLIAYINKEVKGYAFKSEIVDKIIAYCLEHSFKTEEKKVFDTAAVAAVEESK